ncbi:arsenate reductase ArsC [Alcanivorax sp. 1008]|uniref:arsenate reductase ArsC n=1 Tax=Alcanivorax sp. 1008 TaxID=2816853 RepID=UPI001DB2EA9C|nr:arsenate reductase ArsC [Alcanivorax sp. 1008]MCC1496107.1 arsenate reductase ArsC [Alcanivorax sp. 1008]
MELPIRVVFLCTGNSCRSIIAESLANQLGGGKLVAFSAGSFPTGSVNPGALAVLARHQVPAGNPRSKSWDELADDNIHLAITVCDAAAGEACPVWMGSSLRAHWGVADPAHVEGDADTIARAFERTFDEMKQRIEAMLTLPLESMQPTDLVAALADIQRRLETSE